MGERWRSPAGGGDDGVTAVRGTYDVEVRDSDDAGNANTTGDDAFLTEAEWPIETDCSAGTCVLTVRRELESPDVRVRSTTSWRGSLDDGTDDDDQPGGRTWVPWCLEERRAASARRRARRSRSVDVGLTPRRGQLARLGGPSGAPPPQGCGARGA